MEKKKNDVRLNKSLRDVYIKDARRFLESQTNDSVGKDSCFYMAVVDDK